MVIVSSFIWTLGQHKQTVVKILVGIVRVYLQDMVACFQGQKLTVLLDSRTDLMIHIIGLGSECGYGRQ